MLDPVLDPALRQALRRFRSVRSNRPDGRDPGRLAGWWEALAGALDEPAVRLVFRADRERAAAEAESLRAQAAVLRSAGRKTVGEGRRPWVKLLGCSERATGQ